MNKRSALVGIGLSAALVLGTAACGGADDQAAASGPVNLSMTGWSLSTTPEFQTLVDGFEAANPDVTVDIREYDATQYDTQLTADLAAGSAPDLYVLKNLRNFYTYEDGGQLLDVSDVAADLGGDVNGLSSYAVDDVTYAVPYRQDSWYLYYNKDLFDAAGVTHPDGSWTWDDYADAAGQLTTGLRAAGNPALGTYQHVWQSTVQGFALAQAPGADLASGDYDYLQAHYQRSLDLQDAGAQVGYGTATTNTLTYQTQFGTQQAAMMPMGSWYVATLVAQQRSGDAQPFEWGFAPAPQLSTSTTDEPVTFGDPTGIGINAGIDDAKVAAAKEFLRYIGSQDAADALAGLGVTPAVTSEAVTDTYFGIEGIPTDDLSRFTFSTHDTRPENPVAASTAPIQNILNDAHSAIMSGSTPVAAALEQASDRVASEVPSS